MRASRVTGFLLDTTILIDFFRGLQPAVSLLDTLQGKAPLASCPITVAEIFSGAREQELPQVSRFLAALLFYPVTFEAARLAGRWRYDYARRGITLSLNDALIAAVAVSQKLALVTANTRHFPMPELKISTY